MGLPLLTLTVAEAQEAIKRFGEIMEVMPLPGQIRLLVADGVPTIPVQLIETVTAAQADWNPSFGIVWVVERLDTGERLKVTRGALKRQLNEMEAIAWVAAQTDSSTGG